MILSLSVRPSVRLAVLVGVVAGGCARSDGDLVGLEKARGQLVERRDARRALTKDLEAGREEMRRLIREVDAIRADPGYDGARIGAQLSRLANAPSLSVQDDEVSLAGRGLGQALAAIDLAARAAPHLTVWMVSIGVRGDGWSLHLERPECARTGAILEDPRADDVALPSPPERESERAQRVRAEIAALKEELGRLRAQLGPVAALPSLRARLARDRSALGSGARLDRVARLIDSLLGGVPPVLGSATFVLRGDLLTMEGHLYSSDGMGDFAIAVIRAEEPPGDVGWNFGSVERLEGNKLRGTLEWHRRGR